MNKIAFSTVIPTYNRASMIVRAVTSVLKQSAIEDELIVVDDGSTDDTEVRLRPFFDRIRYVKIENSGVGFARNYGIKISRNPVIAFLDSDDEWMPGKLELNRRLLEARPDILFTFSNMAATLKNGEIVHNNLFNWHNDQRGWDEILAPGEWFSSIALLPQGCEDFKVHIGDMYVQMGRANYIAAQTFVVRRDEAGDALAFAEDISLYEDWECFSRVSKKGAGAYLDLETSWQHSHSGKRLTDADTLFRTSSGITVLKRVWGSDKDFLEKHREYYEDILNEQLKLKVRSLISLGRSAEARDELIQVKGAPFHYHILAAMPGTFVLKLLRIRQIINWA